MNNFKKWIICFTISCLLGGLLGYILLWIWFFFRWFFLGYGDSGPSWIITVNDSLFVGGLIIGILGGQILFIIDWKKKEEQTRKR